MDENSNVSTNADDNSAPKKLKMSDIINPMIFAGEDPEKIADAVIAQFPEQADKRDNLIKQIKGPRKYNLKRDHPDKFPPEPKTDEAPKEGPSNS